MNLARIDLRLKALPELDQHVEQPERIREGLLGKGVVLADPENLYIQLLKLGVIGLPGREIRGSRWEKIRPIELEEYHVLPPELV